MRNVTSRYDLCTSKHDLLVPIGAPTSYILAPENRPTPPKMAKSLKFQQITRDLKNWIHISKNSCMMCVRIEIPRSAHTAKKKSTEKIVQTRYFVKRYLMADFFMQIVNLALL